MEIAGPFDVFEGASGEANARTFETYGYTFRAIKVREVAGTHTVACSM